ncbi:MAG TPA: thioredoxin domain-containing protein, partial [Actinomycetota bacterium]
MNRLADETSPYLLQHKDNPVDWQPWGERALAEARERDVPLLVSIGYSACHWCHVMAHESFEDSETAAEMNEHFVCVKVDREERPDLDGIYMDAVQAMTGQGGWPMTVFLTPEGAPFYAGTYFPKLDRPGMPSFQRVLLAVADAWERRREDARRQGAQLVELIAAQATLPGAGGDGRPDEAVLREAFEGLRRSFDASWGGFGPAPKFPQPMTLELLLRCHLRGFDGALDMATLTLDRMAAGGIFDQLGGGFHRYSTDGRWLVPHFEKMLYDNAQLVRVYLHAWQLTGRARYREVAARTADYLLRELRHPDGGFFSSQDADSEGVEGRFFVWDHDELVRVGGEPAARFLGASPRGNWEGTNVLWTPQPAAAVAEQAGTSVEELEHEVEEARARLFQAREARVHPATDDKVLAAWNGLAISALAEAARILGEPHYMDAAVAAAEFVLAALRGPDGRLLRSWRDGRQGGPGYLDDYACMAEACLTLYETTFDLR